MAFALDRDRLVGHVDLDIVLAHARQVGANDELVVALSDLDLRRPREALAQRSGSPPAAAEAEVGKHAIHFVRKTFENPKRTSISRLALAQLLLFPRGDVGWFFRHTSSLISDRHCA